MIVKEMNKPTSSTTLPTAIAAARTGSAFDLALRVAHIPHAITMMKAMKMKNCISATLPPSPQRTDPLGLLGPVHECPPAAVAHSPPRRR